MEAIATTPCNAHARRNSDPTAMRSPEKESPASAGLLFQVVWRWAASRRNCFVLRNARPGRGRLGGRCRFALLLRRLRGFTFLPHQFRGTQLPRPFVEFVTHDALLSVPTTARPSRLLRVVVACYARAWSGVHPVGSLQQRGSLAGKGKALGRLSVLTGCRDRRVIISYAGIA
jgi:hypothetical protein